MAEIPSRRVLYVVVCGAGAAPHVDQLLTAAQEQHWDTYIIATPAGLEFLDADAVKQLTGHAVRSAYRSPDQPRQSMPPADAVIVAPATFNTINKLAAGISDNYALGVLAECIGANVRVVIIPFVNAHLANRAPFRTAVSTLRKEGVRVLLGEGGHQPHPAGHGAEYIPQFPWLTALHEATS